MIILFIIDAMPSGLHERIRMPNLQNLIEEGVLFKKVYLPLPVHPELSSDYPWTCSLPNPVLMSGTIFIGQDDIKTSLIQHSFINQPTAFLVNTDAYYAISHGFTIYEDYSYGIKLNNVFRDELPVEGAKKVILENEPEFIRIHCQDPGTAGHQSHRVKGQPYTGNIWSSGSPFIKQNKYVDELVGDFVRWLKNNGRWNNTVLFVMGDHGQADCGGHPPYEEGSDITQLIVAGAGIKRGITYDYAEIIDIASTIAWLHNIKIPKYSNGRVLKEIKKGNMAPKKTDR